MKKKYEINSEIRVNTHAEVFHCANILYRTMQKKQPGWLYLSLPIVTMCAFSIEGLCNYIGNEKIDFWKEIEKSISIKLKINILMKPKINLWGFEPWQTVFDIIRIRDMLAHPKSEIIKETETLELSEKEVENYPEPQEKWEKIIMNMKKIQDIMEKTENAMEELCKTNFVNVDAIHDFGFWAMTNRRVGKNKVSKDIDSFV